MTEEKLTDRERKFLVQVMEAAHKVAYDKSEFEELRVFEGLIKHSSLSGPGVTEEFLRSIDSAVIRFVNLPGNGWKFNYLLPYFQQVTVDVSPHTFGTKDMYNPSDSHGVVYYPIPHPDSVTGFKLVVRGPVRVDHMMYYYSHEDHELECVKERIFELLRHSTDLMGFKVDSNGNP